MPFAFSTYRLNKFDADPKRFKHNSSAEVTGQQTILWPIFRRNWAKYPSCHYFWKATEKWFESNINLGVKRWFTM